MLTFTTELAGRDPDKPRLTPSEAEKMVTLGFRFAEYDVESERFRLSLPYRMAQNLDRDTLTFMQ